ncbi:MAG: C25 family cysteine peptidase [Anaerolineales bacterium]
MKTSKKLIQISIAFSLVVSVIPWMTKLANAEIRTESNSPVSFYIASSNLQELEIVLSAPSYQILKTKFQNSIVDQLTVPGTVTNSISGEPELPVASRMVAIPPQAQVSLEIVSLSQKQLPGNYLFAISPYPARLDEENSPQRWDSSQVMQQQESIFSTQSPKLPVRIADEAWLRDIRVIRLEFSPFLYNRTSRTLDWFSSVTVKIKFDYPAGTSTFSQTIQPPLEESLVFDQVLFKNLLNTEQAKYWRTDKLPVETLVEPPDTGSRYRIAISKDGIYKLGYEDLFSVNPVISSMSLEKLKMTSQGQDIALYVYDENGDNSFNTRDYIVFYGQRFYGERLANLYQNENQNWYTFTSQNTDGDYISWKPEFNEIMLEKYTHENIYWLFEGVTSGLRMNTESGDPSENSNLPVEYYRETIRSEESYVWKTTLFTGEDSWFWKFISVANTLNDFEVITSNPVSVGPDAVVRAEFVSENGDSDDIDDHHTKTYLNSIILGSSEGFWWSGKSRYAFEAQVPSANIPITNTFSIEALNDAEFRFPRYFFDWVEIEYNRDFIAVKNAITFTSPETGLQKYQVDFSDTTGMIVLNITDPLKPEYVTDSLIEPDQVTISLDKTNLSIAMDAGGKSIAPSQISFYQPPNWKNMTEGADYVIITHTDLINTAQILANYRAGTGLSTVVVNINDLYNEFNFGIFHPIAVKNFLSYTFENWETIPSYALLVGDGHWNFYEYNFDYYGAGPQLIPPNLVWVDPWQGEVDSANLLATIVGDDPVADLTIARLPVNDNAELNAYIDKLIEYESTPFENWMKNHIFVAEDPDSAGDFTTYAENVVAKYIDPFPNATAIEVYQEDYECTTAGSPQCEDAKSSLLQGLNSGALILNYIGHASVNWWSHEKIFSPDDFSALPVTNKLPVILSMTCLDGYWSGPITRPGSSMIEELVRKEASGAIAAFSPTGLGITSGHDVLHQGFYDALMTEGISELGLAVQNSKIWLYQTGLNQDLLHTYTIFGDPALRIRIPRMIFLPLTVAK